MVRSQPLTVNISQRKALYPPNDEWTEPEYIDWGEWTSGTGTGSVGLDAQQKVVREHSIRHKTATPDYYGAAIFTLKDGKEVNCDNYPILKMAIAKEATFAQDALITLEDSLGNSAQKQEVAYVNQWTPLTLPVGSTNDLFWTHEGPFDWSKVKKIRIDCMFKGVNTGSFWIDGIYFTYEIAGLRALDVTVVVKGSSPPILVQGAKVIYGHLVGVDPETGKETYFWMDGEAKITDATGRVVFSELDADWYALKITAEGFKEKTVLDIDARNADPAPITVELEIVKLDIVPIIIVGGVLFGLYIISQRL